MLLPSYWRHRVVAVLPSPCDTYQRDRVPPVVEVSQVTGPRVVAHDTPLHRREIWESMGERKGKGHRMRKICSIIGGGEGRGWSRLYATRHGGGQREPSDMVGQQPGSHG